MYKRPNVFILCMYIYVCVTLCAFLHHWQTYHCLDSALSGCHFLRFDFLTSLLVLSDVGFLFGCHSLRFVTLYIYILMCHTLHIRIECQCRLFCLVVTLRVLSLFIHIYSCVTRCAFGVNVNGIVHGYKFWLLDGESSFLFFSFSSLYICIDPYHCFRRACFSCAVSETSYW